MSNLFQSTDTVPTVFVYKYCLTTIISTKQQNMLSSLKQDGGPNVSGTSTMFVYYSDNGVFTQEEIKCKRIKPESISKFTCIWNTNLQCILAIQNTRGVSVVVRLRGEWRLCFACIWKRGNHIALQWKGILTDDGIPKFLTMDKSTLQQEWKDHFIFRDLGKEIDECYFVNLQPPYTSTVSPNFLVSGKWIPHNAIDGCISQSENGPCCIWMPHIFDVHPIKNSVLSLKRKKRVTKRRHDRRTKIDWLVRPEKCDEIVYDIVYVKKNTTQVLYPKDGFVWIPSYNGRVNECTPKGWSLERFYKIDSVKKIEVPNGGSMKNFHDYAQGHKKQVFQRLVHHGKNLRIQICDHTVYNSLKNDDKVTYFQWDGGREAYFAQSKLQVQYLKGVNISTWGTNDRLSNVRNLDITFAEDVYRQFQTGFGSRCTSQCAGINLYFGQRDSNRPKVSPFVGPFEASKQHYFRRQWSKNGMESKRLELEKMAVTLPTEENVLLLNKNYSQWIGLEVCDKTILTLGIPKGIFSFINETHIDKGDLFNEELKDIWIERLKNAPSKGEQYKIVEKIHETCLYFDYDNPGVCCPTTCAYRHLWGEKTMQCNAFQHFDYCDFGLAKTILDTSIHWMLAAGFYHRTSLCILLCNDRVYWKACDDTPKFTLLGWGRTGGKPKQQHLKKRCERK